MSESPAGWPPLGRQVTLKRTPAFSVFSAGGSPASVDGLDRSDHAERNKKGLPPATTAAAADTRSVASVRPTPAMAETGAGCSDSSREAGVVCVDVVCPYTRALVLEGLERRRGAWRVTTDSAEASLHWGDYEMIDWERVVSGELRASSYCVRKGLSRKAQLSKYCNKYVSKRPGTLLKGALPRTLVIDTWEAFDDEMTFNLGGDIAAFGSDLGVRQSVSLATRLDWCLGEAREWIEQDEEGQDEEEEATPQVPATATQRKQRFRPQREASQLHSRATVMSETIGSAAASSGTAPDQTGKQGHEQQHEEDPDEEFSMHSSTEVPGVARLGSPPIMQQQQHLVMHPQQHPQQRQLHPGHGGGSFGSHRPGPGWSGISPWGSASSPLLIGTRDSQQHQQHQRGEFRGLDRAYRTPMAVNGRPVGTYVRGLRGVMAGAASSGEVSTGGSSQSRPSPMSSSLDLTAEESAGAGSSPDTAAASGAGGSSSSCKGSGALDKGHDKKSGAPPPGLEQRRVKVPNYHKHYDKVQLSGELTRRADGRKPVVFGPGPKDKVTRVSKLSKRRIVECLEEWDSWNVAEGGGKWYESSTLETPEKKKGKQKRQGSGATSGDEDEPALDRRRPSDLPRLIAIIFSEEFWEGVCRTEEGSNNRSSNKRESNLLKDRHPVWRKVAAAYLDPEWKDQGSLPSHPVDHAAKGCDGDTDMELEIQSLVEALEDVDYIGPAERWRAILKDDEGHIDMVSAGAKFAGWWKFLRGELRDVRAKEDLSGNHERHSWRFCSNKVTSQLMLDFLERAGGDMGNDFSKEYLNAELDEDSGAAFNTCDDAEDESSDDEDGNDEGSEGGRRQKRPKKQPSRRSVAKKSIMEAIEKGGQQMKETGEAMVREMQRSSQPSVSELLDQVNAVGKELDTLDDAIDALEADPGRSERKLARKKEQLEMTTATYKKLKEQHGKAMVRSYEEV